MKKKVLITGVAGFIGFHLALKLHKKFNIIGVDNISNYYDTKLKQNRLKLLYTKIKFYKLDIKNFKLLEKIFKKEKFDIVINLAAQAGVRLSVVNTKEYFDSNILGFYNIIELSKKFKIKHFLYASSSSVYGLNKKIPFSEKDSVNHQSNFYGASKRTNEIISYTYSHLHNLPCTGLRFFTVYGPWGRPDMALFKFTKNILENKFIEVNFNGKMLRDFTYIDDVVKIVSKLINLKPKKESANKKKIIRNGSSAPWIVYNIGKGKPDKLLEFINTIEKSLGKKANIKFLPKNEVELEKTHSSNSKLFQSIRKIKYTDLKTGIKKFINWYIEYYKIKL